MKRVFLLLFFLFSTGIALHLLIVRGHYPEDTIDLLPADTALLLTWQDKETQHKMAMFFTKGQRAVPLAHPLAQYVLRQLDLDQEEALSSEVSNFLDFLSTLFSTKNLPPGKTSLALLPDYTEDGHLVTSFSPTKMVLFFPLAASDLSEQQQIACLFGSIISTDVYQYNKYTIHSFHLENGQSISFCQYKHILLCSFALESIKQCIDQPFKKIVLSVKSLRQDTHYLAMQEYGKDASAFLYVQPAFIQHRLAKGSSRIGDFCQFLLSLACFYNSTAGEEQWQVLARSVPGQWHTWSDQYGLAYSSQLPLLKTAQPETLLHFWFNGLSPQLLHHLDAWWRKTDAEADAEESSPFLLQAGELSASFFDVFGSQVELRIDEQQKSQHASSLVACGQIQVRNSQQLTQLLDAILDKVPKETRMVGKISMTSLLMAGGLIRPSYVLTREHLVVADTPQLLIQTLAQVEDQDIKTNKQEYIFPPFLMEPKKIACFFLFLNMRELSPRLLSFLHALTLESQGDKTMILDQDRQQIKHVLIPCLTALRQIETLRLQATLLGDDLVFEFVMKR